MTKKKEEEENNLIDSRLMIFSGSDFMLKQSKAGYASFDLYREKVINKGKDTERTDLVLVGYNIPLETSIGIYIMDKLKDSEYTLKEYLKEYERLLKNIIEEIIYENN